MNSSEFLLLAENDDANNDVSDISNNSSINESQDVECEVSTKY